MMHANTCKEIPLVTNLMGYFYFAKASLSLHPRPLDAFMCSRLALETMDHIVILHHHCTSEEIQ